MCMWLIYDKNSCDVIYRAIAVQLWEFCYEV